MDIDTIKEKTIPILKSKGVTKASIFGSYAKDTATTTSDIDLLIDFKDKKSLLDLISLKADLEKITDKRVDLLTYRSINPLIRDEILNSQQIIYEES